MATKFYLPYSGTAPAITPAVDAAWEVSSGMSRLPTFITKTDTPLTNITWADSDATSQDICLRQYITEPIAAQTIGVQTVTFCIRGKAQPESNGLITLGIRTVSNDGSTVRGTNLAVTRDGNELHPSGAMRSRVLTATTSSVAAQANDRLLIEIGIGGDPDAGSDHDCTLRIGDSAVSDLAGLDDETGDLNPYVEFGTTTILFAAGGGGAPVAIAVQSTGMMLKGMR